MRSATIEADLDAVVLWLTVTIERDYGVRSVLPRLRSGNAIGSRANATLHLLSIAEARAALEDAELRQSQVAGSVKTAFKAHADNLRAAIKQASTRPAEHAAEKPMCLHRGEWRENWRGSKEQFQRMGIGAGLAFPGEPGGKRWCRTRDRRGFLVRITKASELWPNVYEACIEIPQAERNARAQDSKSLKADKDAIERLKSLPDTAEKFRADVADTFRLFVDVMARTMRAKDGFRYTEEAIDDFLDVIRDASETLAVGQTEGRPPAEKLQQALGAQAKANGPLQAFLAIQRAHASTRSE
jgi:hypothetical protein